MGMEVCVASREKSKPPPRRLIQFSLRALLIVVLAVGVWLGVRAQRIHRHEKAIHAIESLGGSVSVEFDRSSLTPSWVDSKTGWLVGLASPTVTVAYWPPIENPKVLIRHLKDVHNLHEMHITNNLRHRKRDQLSDAAVEAFEREFPAVWVKTSRHF